MRTRLWIAAALAVSLLQLLSACRNREASMRVAAGETAAVAQLHALSTAETAFNASNNHYACTIAELASSPGLIDRETSTGQKNGYAFSVHCYPQVDLPAYQIWASPLEPGESGVNFYCTDQTAVVRRTGRLLETCAKASPVE